MDPDNGPVRARDALPAPRAWVDRHPLAATLEAARPGPVLVGALDRLEAADLDGAALLEGVAAWERVAAWVVARQGLLLAEMARRARGLEVDLVPDEVATRLAVTRRAAERTVELAVALDGAPALHAALSAGEIDGRKARVLVEGSEHLPHAARDAVRAEALVQAPGLTAPQLQAVVRRLEIAVDTEGAEQRHARARADRCVRIVPATDAMAWIHALLPAPDAVTVMTAVDALAAAAAPDDLRGIEARRADGLVDVMRQVLDAGIGPQGLLPTAQGRRPHLAVTVNPAAVLGLPDAHAHLAGYGPIPAGLVQEIAEQASWRAVAVDPLTGELSVRTSRTYRPGRPVADLVIDRDVTCTFPGCRIASTRCDLDHIEPFDHDRPAETQTRTTNLHALCRHHHRLKTFGGWRPSRDPATGVTTWTSPMGRTYTRDPVPLDPTLDDRPRRRARPTSCADDPAPEEGEQQDAGRRDARLDGEEEQQVGPEALTGVSRRDDDGGEGDGGEGEGEGGEGDGGDDDGDGGDGGDGGDDGSGDDGSGDDDQATDAGVDGTGEALEDAAEEVRASDEAGSADLAEETAGPPEETAGPPEADDGQPTKSHLGPEGAPPF